MGKPWRLLAVALVVVGTQRVVNVDKLVDYLRWDLSAWTGERSREDYLARFGARESGDKFSAVAVRELAGYLRAHSAPQDTVLLLGFSPGALLQSERKSATRFCWSRPLIVGFGEGWPGYGVQGLLGELRASRPTLVVLQRRDWDPDTIDSYDWFFRQPALVAWLDAGYDASGSLGNYAVWRSREAARPGGSATTSVRRPRARRAHSTASAAPLWRKLAMTLRDMLAGIGRFFGQSEGADAPASPPSETMGRELRELFLSTSAGQVGLAPTEEYPRSSAWPWTGR